MLTCMISPSPHQVVPCRISAVASTQAAKGLMNSTWMVRLPLCFLLIDLTCLHQHGDFDPSLTPWQWHKIIFSAIATAAFKSGRILVAFISTGSLVAYARSTISPRCKQANLSSPTRVSTQPISAHSCPAGPRLCAQKRALHTAHQARRSGS